MRDNAPKRAEDFGVTLCRLGDLSESTAGPRALAFSELTMNVLRHASKATVNERLAPNQEVRSWLMRIGWSA
ncbi:hypothetical protein [Actinomadura rubteroloni]|uniref:hypothetical protein n=1 Tax=Actinomadura rubteroloni TaxID=1926885 RepID=UPI0011B09D0D|nr:hypothetical protein [Actinomadura rubteroloni]